MTDHVTLINTFWASQGQLVVRLKSAPAGILVEIPTGDLHSSTTHHEIPLYSLESELGIVVRG